MKSRTLSAAAVLAVALSAQGCGKQSGAFFRAFNQRPTVNLTAAPIGTADTAWYSYEIHWSGSDPDGRIERFEYAIDPPTAPAADTAWIATTNTREQFYFRATEPYWDPVHGWRANGFHVFAIRAVDDRGAFSPVVSRAFFSYTIAPTVRITLPAPSPLLSRQLPQGARIEWKGADEDGVGSKQPVRYKYRLFRSDDSEFNFTVALVFPDSLRRFYAARSFAGWDSVSGDTTSVSFGLLELNVPHLFVVIAIDEAGAYSPEFSLETNMLRFTPVLAAGLGPRFTVYNDYFRFEYPSGGTSEDPLSWINLELPAGMRFTFHWFATPIEGTSIAGYRWKLDDGEWSVPGDTTNVTLGPFAGGEEHFLYLWAEDSWGLGSLAIIHFRIVALTLEHELLVVDDTRLAPDRLGASGVPLAYANTYWPAAAELDTFLFARGGFPWRGPQGISGDLPLSKPGVFEGYAYDTLGTRRGFEIASAGVPLGLLGRYRHVLWLTDLTGALTTGGPDSPVDPLSTLRWMSAPGRTNTLAAYLFSGGEVWLAGGTGLTCATLPYNATGSHINDNIFGPGYTVFSATAGELAPGRFAWDAAHWRSEFVASRPLTLPRRSTWALGSWSQPGWQYSRPVTAPDYSRLPASLRRRALALGDSLPPTRTGYSASFYSTAISPAVEYLTIENFIHEDVDPDPGVTDSRAVLDTLMQFQGGALATQFTGNVPVAMTYYHGIETPRFVSTGFDLWTWSRQDVAALVDFVLQDIWGMNRVMSRPAAHAPVTRRPSAARQALPVPAAR